MRYTLAAFLCMAICGFTIGNQEIQAGESSPASSTPAFYTWLDKYQNPNAASATAFVSPAPRTTSHQETISASSLVTALPSSWEAASDGAPSQSGASVVGPGEGLGCYYHRSYYSHLPLFNTDGNYTLRGDVNVAEPYHQPSDRVSAASPSSSR